MIKFQDITEGVTVNEEFDEVTGLSRKVVVESRDAEHRPQVVIRDPSTNQVLKLGSARGEARYLLPVGANIVVRDGDAIEQGQAHCKDSTRNAQDERHYWWFAPSCRAFRGSAARDPAVISEIDGWVEFGKDTKGKRKIIVRPEVGEPKEYLVAKGKALAVRPGDRVQAGEPLIDGAANPHDILLVLGDKELAKFLVDEIQEVYRLQGVRINDKHIETIVRQMLRRVKITDVGDTNFLLEEQVEKWLYERGE